MCGIIGYVGRKEAEPILVEGLRRLEYRGYDSAGLATLNGRMISVALPDLRGALGFGVDEASWIPTAYNMALMFIGPFSVFLGGLLGVRRVLLFAGTIFIL